MSYVLTSYLADIPKLKQLVGSKDASLLAAVIARKPEFFELDDEDDEIEDDELTVRCALRHLIMGEEKNSDEAHQYGYALEALCAYLGERLSCHSWNGVRWSAVEQCGLQHLLTETEPPIELPTNSDFPYIGHIERTNVDDFLHDARNRAAQGRDHDIQDLLEEYLGWLATTADRGLDLVLFYH